MADTNGVTVFTLKSMYAEKEDDSLMFSLADGCLNLIETEFCKNIDAGVFGMLAANKSIPVFLANVTSDLFGRSTVM
jgi:Mitotic checkpoint protein